MTEKRVEKAKYRPVHDTIIVVVILGSLLLMFLGIWLPIILVIIVLGPYALYVKFIKKSTRTVGSHPYVPGRDCPTCGGWGTVNGQPCGICGGRKTR